MRAFTAKIYKLVEILVTEKRYDILPQWLVSQRAIKDIGD